MSRFGPLIAAVTVFPLIALGAAVPYVAHQYRQRGTVGAGQLLLGGAVALYLVGLAFAVILPLRPVSPDFCSLYGGDVYLSPLRVFDEIRAEAAGSLGHALRSQIFQQVVLNVALFVPLGMFVRHIFGRGIAATIAIGFGVSMLIELTQLTGNWFIYPCAYRFFDSVDLLSNTTGAAIGAVIAPALRLIPAQLTTADPSSPQPVTPLRRLLASVCDAAAVLLLGVVLMALAGLVLEATRGQLFESASIRARALRSIALIGVPGLVVMLAAPLAFGGRTPGQWAVLIRPVAPGGRQPRQGEVIGRFLIGPAALIALVGLAVLGLEEAWLAAVAVGAVQILAILATPLDEDGAALLRTGFVRLEDSRRERPAATNM